MSLKRGFTSCFFFLRQLGEDTEMMLSKKFQQNRPKSFREDGQQGFREDVQVKLWT